MKHRATPIAATMVAEVVAVSSPIPGSSLAPKLVVALPSLPAAGVAKSLPSQSRKSYGIFILPYFIWYFERFSSVSTCYQQLIQLRQVACIFHSSSA
jgi:hypothetical protein